jgi:hypothetical protein
MIYYFLYSIKTIKENWKVSKFSVIFCLFIIITIFFFFTGFLGWMIYGVLQIIKFRDVIINPEIVITITMLISHILLFIYLLVLIFIRKNYVDSKIEQLEYIKSLNKTYRAEKKKTKYYTQLLKSKTSYDNRQIQDLENNIETAKLYNQELKRFLKEEKF